MNEEDIIKAKDIISNYKNKSNVDLTFAMDILQKDFDFTKQTLIKMSEHLDMLEKSYELLLTEYQSRKDGIKNRYSLFSPPVGWRVYTCQRRHFQIRGA